MGPALAGLELLGADEDPRVVAQLVGHLEHRHEAGVHPDDVDRPAEHAVGVGQDLLQLAVVEAVARAVVVGDAPAGVGGEQPLARRLEEAVPEASGAAPGSPRLAREHLRRDPEAGAVVREDQHRRARREPLGAERDEVLQHARVAGVGGAEVREERRADPGRVRAPRHVVAPRPRPVAVGGVLATRAVDLGEDLHRARPRADALHLAEIAEQRALEVVVAGEVRENRPARGRRLPLLSRVRLLGEGCNCRRYRRDRARPS